MLLGDLDNFDPEHPQEGMYPNMPEQLYRSARAWNWSTLRYGVDTMSKVKWALDHPQDIEDSDDKLLGRCFDIVHLQPENVEKLIAIQPVIYESEASKGRGANKVITPVEKPWNKNANICRAWATEQADASREILRRKDMDRLEAMVESLNQIAGVREMIDGALIQPSIFWRDGVPDKQKGTTGLMCKARLDCYKNGIVGDDKKVAKSAAWESFSGHVKAYRIYCQAAMNLDGVNALLKLAGAKPPDLQYFRMMVVEDHPPFDAAVYDLYDREGAGSQAWLKAGRLVWHGILQRVAHCIRKDKWPGHNADSNPEGNTEVEELEPPEWVVKKLETI